MGRNSKARRDARKRKQGRQSKASGHTTPRPGGWGDFDIDAVALADLQVIAEVRRLGVRGSDEDARRRAARLQRVGLPPWALRAAAADLLGRLVGPTLRGGWSPAELAEAVRRVVGERHEAVVAGLVEAASRDGMSQSAVWNTELAQLGRPRALVLDDVGDLALALRLAALISVLPAAETPIQRHSATSSNPMGSRASSQLTRVRALLAKAEATTFTDEAEALSAKAQELISKHSLQLLLDNEDDRASCPEPSTTFRRLWLDAPYVDAKANLVDEIAAANRCRSVHHVRLGYCTVVGSRFDLDAVELMLTSLLAQAQRAMLRHGSRSDGAGRSRTRSFRQSFLVSFAVHIGRRLREVADDSVTTAADRSALVPAIRHHEADVNDLTATLFPQLIQRVTSVTNAEGWAGGQAAAALADLDILEAVRA